MIEEVKWKEVLTRTDLQRILGTLNHWSEVVVAGRIFVNRLLQAFKQMSQSQDYFRPTEGFRKDLRWWEQVAPHLNYQSMMIPRKSGPDMVIEMDASLKWGIGAVNHRSKEFFLVETPSILNGLPIHCAEMSTLMLVVDVWNGVRRTDPQSPGVADRSTFKSAETRLYSDNQAVIQAINNGRASDEFLCLGMRFVH